MLSKRFATALVVGLLCCSVCNAVSNAQPPVDNFVIPATTPNKKQKLSLNTIKEQVGTTTKQVFDHSTAVLDHMGILQHVVGQAQSNADDEAPAAGDVKKMMTAHALYNRACGTIQRSVASLQRKCSTIIENIIDNRAPFKKASREELEASLIAVAGAKDTVAAAADSVQTLCNSVKKGSHTIRTCCVSLQSVTKALEVQGRALQATVTAFSSDTCLKKA